MAITDEIRKAFDECTVMAGVENDFECVYVTKAAALLYLNEIDAAFRELLEENERFIIKLNAEHIARQNVELENDKLRELVRDVYSLHWHGVDCTECPWFDECDNHGGGCPWLGILANRMSELGIEATE